MSARALSRRDFLDLSARLGGGLILSLTLPACAPKRPAGGSAGAASATGDASAHQVNAWLRIGTDNTITMLVDRSEMGQGVYTALPMLMAEELHVPLTAIRVEAAPVGDAYVNEGTADK